MSNKFVSAFLALLMMVSALPGAVMGAEEASSELQNVYYRLSVDKEAKIGYLGGSITQGYLCDKDPWADVVGSWITEKFPNAKVENVNAGLGGTGSKFGSYRAYRDLKIAEKAPDLVFIEFAVNDLYEQRTEAETKRYYESVIRRIYASNPKCRIISLYTTDLYRKGGDFDCKTWQKEIADYYGIPSIDIGAALWNTIVAENNGQNPTQPTDAVWKKYFADYVHPNTAGHAVYAQEIINYLNEQLFGDTVTRNETQYKDLFENKNALTNAYADGNSKNFTEAGFYKAYTPGYVLKATNSGGSPSNDILAYAGGATLKFEFTGTAAGFYNEAISSDGNVTYTVTRKSDNAVMVQNTVAVKSRALTMFAEDLANDTYIVTVTSDKDRRFRYVVYSGSNLEICKDRPDAELVTADKVFNAFDQVSNMSQTAASKDGNSTYLYEVTGTGKPMAQRWAINYLNIFMDDYRYAVVDYYLDYPESSTEQASIGVQLGGASPVDDTAELATGAGIVTKAAKKNVWATAVIDMQPIILKWMQENPLYTNIRRFYFYPFGDVNGSDVPEGAKLYVKSVKWSVTNPQQEGEVTLSFAPGLAAAAGQTPVQIKSDTSEVIKIPVNPYTVEGYKFAGWAVNGTIYQPSDSFTTNIAGNYIAYALWIPEEADDVNTAYVSESGYIDSDINGEPDMIAYKSISEAYKYFEGLDSADEKTIYISGSAALSTDANEKRGKVTIKGIDDSAILTRSEDVVLKADLTIDNLTLSSFNSKTFSANGHMFTIGNGVKADGTLIIESHMPYDAAEGTNAIIAPSVTFNSPQITYNTINTARNGASGLVKGNANYVFNSGNFTGTIVAGSWLYAMSNHNISLKENVNYTFNGGSYSNNIFLGSRYNVGVEGNVIFTVNGGSFTSGKTITFGHSENSSQGYSGYSGVKNSAVIINAESVLERGGSVNGLKITKKTGNMALNSDGAEIVIVNNSEKECGVVLDDSLTSGYRFNVEGGKANPVFESGVGGALLGFEINADNPRNNKVLLDGEEIKPNENGIYSLSADTTAGSAGVRTITFKKSAFAIVDGTSYEAVDDTVKIGKSGTINLSSADLPDGENKYFVGWKNQNDKYVVTGDSVSDGDVLTAQFITADEGSIKIGAAVDEKALAVRYSASAEKALTDALYAIKGIGMAKFEAPKSSSDTNIGYGIIIASGDNLSPVKETENAAIKAAVGAGAHDFSAVSEVISNDDIEKNLYSARAYVTYADTLGNIHTIYSDVCGKTLYQAAAEEYKDESTAADRREYLLTNILDAASRIANPFSNTAKLLESEKKLTIGYIGGSITNGYSAGEATRVRNSNKTFSAAWADKSELTKEALAEKNYTVNDNWGNWNVTGLQVFYDENGVKYTEENADFIECSWNDSTNSYEYGSYFNIIRGDISLNWANRVTNWFKASFPEAEISSVNVGISGTPSSFGASRIEKDLLYSDGHDVPDLVFIEFTVNDWLYPDEVVNGRTTDGLIQNNSDLKRQVESMLLSIWKANPYAEIALIYTAGENAPTSKLHTIVGDYYNIPHCDVASKMGELKRERLSKIWPGEGSKWYESVDKKDRYYTKDNLHPSVIGYGLYFDEIKEHLLDKYITNDMTYGSTLYNYANAYKDKAPVDEWSMLNPTHILAEDFTWTGTEGEELKESGWGFWNGLDKTTGAWVSTEGCEFDYQKAPAAVGSMYYTENAKDQSMNFAETPSTIHVTSDQAQASFEFDGRAFGFIMKLLYHNVDMLYQVDGGEWKKFRIAADNGFYAMLYENVNFTFAEQNLEEGHHKVNLKFVNSAGRYLDSANEVNVYLGAAVTFSSVDQAQTKINYINGISENSLSVGYSNPDKNGIIIAAVYDSNKNLIDTQLAPANSDKAVFNLNVPQTEGTTIKAMLIEDLKSIKPMCGAKTVEFANGIWVNK